MVKEKVLQIERAQVTSLLKNKQKKKLILKSSIKGK